MTGSTKTKSAALALAALLALAVLVPSSPLALARKQKRSHSPAHRTVVTYGPARVACTVLGCQPIPAACTPVAGRTPSGLPTGYDVIVCPPGIWPLR
jgi:hypothetical protein